MSLFGLFVEKGDLVYYSIKGARMMSDRYQDDDLPLTKETHRVRHYSIVESGEMSERIASEVIWVQRDGKRTYYNNSNNPLRVIQKKSSIEVTALPEYKAEDLLPGDLIIGNSPISREYDDDPVEVLGVFGAVNDASTTLVLHQHGFIFTVKLLAGLPLPRGERTQIYYIRDGIHLYPSSK